MVCEVVSIMSKGKINPKHEPKFDELHNAMANLVIVCDQSKTLVLISPTHIKPTFDRNGHSGWEYESLADTEWEMIEHFKNEHPNSIGIASKDFRSQKYWEVYILTTVHDKDSAKAVMREVIDELEDGQTQLRLCQSE